MRFEARELKPHGEPVSSSNLREGEVYFSVQYADEKMCLPIMEPFVFLGRDLDGGHAGQLFFQNYESYSAGIRYESATNDEAIAFQVCSPHEINHIFEYEYALESLMKCSLRRRETKSF